MAKIIGQREARRLRRRVQQLECVMRERARSWSSEYPGGVHLKTIKWPEIAAVAHVARQLGHALVLKTTGGDDIYLYAVKDPLPDEESRR